MKNHWIISAGPTREPDILPRPPGPSQGLRGIACTLFALLLVVLPACSDAASTDNPGDTTVNAVSIIINDMRLPHEERPHGVPEHVGWSVQPRVGMGNDPGDFRAMIAWGQLYEAASGNPATNSRVEFRGFKAYILSKADDQWHLVQDAKGIEGAAYEEDFAADNNRPADTRREPSGNLSATAGDGHNYHFWPAEGRIEIQPDDIAAVLVTLQARLILDDPNGPDDRHEARYVLSVGGDYWLSRTAPWDFWTTNGDIGIGRFKYVQPDWRAFNMSTASVTQLRENPPPLD